jgi:hypothetical protein
VQPARQIADARRLALNVARSQRLDIAELFHRWRRILRSRSESRGQGRNQNQEDRQASHGLPTGSR